MKKLGRRNLYYSLLLAGVLMLCLVGYFVLMMPSLYVNYVEEQNLEAVIRQHQAFMKNGTYDGVKVKNPTACISIKIPLEGNTIELTSKMVSIKITAEDAEMKALLADIQDMANDFDIRNMKYAGQLSGQTSGRKEKGFSNQQLEEKISAWKDKAVKLLRDRSRLPVNIEFINTKDSGSMYFAESFQLHAVSEHMAVIEASAADDSSRYTNYLAAEKASDGMVFSILPVITPEMQEILPVVLQSLPMLCAVILMLVLIFSRIYSGGIVLPVYQKLQDANQALQEENERQEVFLRASSHQLKTPVAAALLLTDGMINEIGKYRDTKKYLPDVKKQLLSMQKMIDEILSMNRCRDSADRCRIVLYDFMQALLESYGAVAAEKNLEICLKGDREAFVFTDSGLLFKIMDNLLSNAAAYTPRGEQVCIVADQKSITIWNGGVTIPQEVLRHIFDPFVKGSQGAQSHGLGLYIADYYAKRMGARLYVRNKGSGVEAVLEF